jgi:hypothetical protein
MTDVHVLEHELGCVGSVIVRSIGYCTRDNFAKNWGSFLGCVLQNSQSVSNTTATDKPGNQSDFAGSNTKPHCFGMYLQVSHDYPLPP